MFIKYEKIHDLSKLNSITIGKIIVLLGVAVVILKEAEMCKHTLPPASPRFEDNHQKIILNPGYEGTMMVFCSPQGGQGGLSKFMISSHPPKEDKKITYVYF